MNSFKSTISCSVASAGLGVFVLIAVGCTSGDPQSEALRTQLAEMLQHQFVDGHKLPAVLLAVDRPGKESIRVAAGVRDINSQTAVQPDDHVRIASITKTFTALAILQLAEEGKLSIEDPLDKWLPGVMRHFPFHQKIKIVNLLNHTSGLPTEWRLAPADLGVVDPTGCEPCAADGSNLFTCCIYYNLACTSPAAPIIKALTLVAAIDKAAEANPPPDIAIPAPWSYANVNYLLLGMIVEKATAHAWEDEIQTRFIEPLGLTETSIPRMGAGNTELPSPAARGYVIPADNCPLAGTGQELVDYTNLAPDSTWASGSMISTVGDLARWMRAIASGRLLNAEHQKLLMTAEHVPMQGCPGRPQGEYGLGISFNDLPGFWGKTGDIFGYACAMYYQMAKDTGFVACTTKTLPFPNCSDSNYPPKVLEDTHPVITSAAALTSP